MTSPDKATFLTICVIATAITIIAISIAVTSILTTSYKEQTFRQCLTNHTVVECKILKNHNN